MGSNELRVTAADVMERQQELRDLGIQIDKLRARQADVQRWLESAHFMAPQLFSEKLAASPLNSTELESWNDLIFFALNGERGGRSQRFILKVGERTNMADRVRQSPNSLYNATFRLVDNGQLIKDGTLYYLPEVYERIKAGELIEEPEEGARSGANSARHVIDALTPDLELTPADIYERISVDGKPPFSRSYLYTLLSRMVAKGDLKKRGESYRLSQNAEEDPELNPEPSLDLVHRESAAGTRGLSLVHPKPTGR